MCVWNDDWNEQGPQALNRFKDDVIQSGAYMASGSDGDD